MTDINNSSRARGDYLKSASDNYIRKTIDDLNVLISRAESNIVNWQKQLDDALAEAERRWETPND